MLTHLLKRSFSKLPFRAKKSKITDQLDPHRAEIDLQLEKASELVVELNDIVSETKAMSSELAYKLDNELMLAKRQLDSMSKTLSDGMIFLDHVGRVMHFNVAAESILGILAPDAIGKSIFSLLRPRTSDGASLQDTAIARCSRRIFDKIRVGATIEGENIANVTCLGKCSIIDTDTPAGFKKLSLTLNVLEPNPKKSSDVSYVCVFRPA